MTGNNHINSGVGNTKPTANTGDHVVQRNGTNGTNRFAKNRLRNTNSTSDGDTADHVVQRLTTITTGGDVR